ncbi:MAG: aspartate/glutamate racemase family protein [Ignavibacteriae bacterium]|nr:aspartate/glutamate racemase family protein [Ignavibacteriota bacterium]
MNNIAEKLKKDHLKIIVTDSGLGGLAVQALLDKQLRKLKINSKIELIFFNSVALHDYGYNDMLDHEEKITVFDSALTGMLKLDPDLILIACNTLSVLYYETKTSKSIKIPVLGIADTGVELILEKIQNDDSSNIILFGTETTIKSNQHKNKLITAGVKSERIVSQPCKLLESEIQIDPKSIATEKMIGKFVNESFEKVNDLTSKSYAVLCCTHYGYSKDIFQKLLNEKFNKDVVILNPNEKMAEIAADIIDKNGNENPVVTNFVYSRVDIIDSEMEKLGSLLAMDSPSLYESLKDYKHLPDLFYFDDTNYQKSKK